MFQKYFSPEWWEFLRPILGKKFLRTMTSIRSEYKQCTIYPSSGIIFSVFSVTPFDKLKIVVIGADPYPTKEHAHGLAFSSLSLDRPKSLSNIFHAIQEDYFKGTKAPYNEVCVGNDLTQWAHQGVLLLNKTLTVREGAPGSHRELWEGFVKQVILLLNSHPNRLVYFLWGAEAHKLESSIKGSIVFKGPHPVSRTEEFLVNHFTEGNGCLRSMNMSEVNWGVYDSLCAYYKIDVQHPDEQWPEKSIYVNRYYEPFFKSITNGAGLMFLDGLSVAEGKASMKELAKYLYKHGRGDAPDYIKPRVVAELFKGVVMHQYCTGSKMSVQLIDQPIPF